ncbi:MAG TPA: sulfotransferase family 2 domain-containing protein [Candidatus Dormibacteraeota bacterium]|nr:sulfotransferase family 2 domain-containing protein [Candidatus Dormibacteraeota bacterium]
MSPQRSVIFLHIPKTGGMSFSRILARQFPPATVYQINGRLSTSAAELRGLPDERRLSIQCVYGHVPFGLHEHLPRSPAYVALFRDPVERIISTYYYALRRAEWDLHRQIREGKWSLHDFVVSDLAAEFHNQQTQMVSGADGPVDTVDALTRAKKNVNEHFALAGVTERFDESILLCRGVLGWKNVFYHRANVNRHRPRLCEISRSTIAMIEKRNALDLELYEIVRQRFEVLVRECPTVARDLRRFRQFNGLYGAAASLFTVPMNLLRGSRAAIRRLRPRHAAGNR